jgi:hypothetical protein
MKEGKGRSKEGGFDGTKVKSHFLKIRKSWPLLVGYLLFGD